jgi:hypothetical protein
MRISRHDYRICYTPPGQFGVNTSLLESAIAHAHKFPVDRLIIFKTQTTMCVKVAFPLDFPSFSHMSPVQPSKDFFMNHLSSTIAKTIASAVVTAAALSGNVMAAGCAGAKCGPKTNMAKCGACKAKCGAAKPQCAASKAHAAKAKTKRMKAKCGACAAKS